MKPQDSLVVDHLDEERYWKAPKSYGSTVIKGYQLDCVDVAISMKSRGLNPPTWPRNPPKIEYISERAENNLIFSEQNGGTYNLAV